MLQCTEQKTSTDDEPLPCCWFQATTTTTTTSSCQRMKLHVAVAQQEFACKNNYGAFFSRIISVYSSNDFQAAYYIETLTLTIELQLQDAYTYQFTFIALSRVQRWVL
jgi:hypothetical protein